MRVVIQRVSSASVTINGKVKSAIQEGLLILAGFEDADADEDLNWLSNKIAALRIFPDENGVMNKSILEVNGEVLLISQFTLHANTKKGNRPSYIKAAKPDKAIPLYHQFIQCMESLMKGRVFTGEFGADMKVALVNDGPVTIVVDTKNKE